MPFARILRPRLLLAIFFIAVTVGVVGAKTDALSFTAAPISNFAAAKACSKPKLLGVFVPWYQYLKVTKDADTGTCGINGDDFVLLPGNGQSSSVPLVLLAIVDDMVRLAGLIAVIFVIVGGVQYATSQGSPDATAKAQSTVINALIGLAIAIAAVAFVAFLGKALT
jgi:hypothetical protein